MLRVVVILSVLLSSCTTQKYLKSNFVEKIDSKRILLLDDRLIDRSKNIILKNWQPTEGDLVIVHDELWEGSFYHTIIKDDSLFRLYYRCMPYYVENSKIKIGKSKACYAESLDGIKWVKPKIGKIEFEGSKNNNILFEGIGTHNFTPFIDKNPNALIEEKYKAVGGHQAKGGLFLFISENGIDWERVSDNPINLAGKFDSQNLIFYDEEIKKYRI